MSPAALPEAPWYPVRFDPAASELLWLHLPGEEFREPFFEDSIRLRRRQAAALRTPLDALLQVPPDAAGPRAIFFHASRCGSTLAMQVLGRVPGCRSLSEPPVLDELLNHPGTEDAHLSGLLRAYARAETGPAPAVFLKTDSWHLPHLDRLRRIFPAAPCYFLYREPAAILRSHRRERGSQMVPGLLDPACFGIDRAAVNPADLEGYARQVLAAIFRQALAAAEAGKVLPLSYSLLPGYLWEHLGPVLGLPRHGWEAAKERAARDAKHAHRPHESSPAPPESSGDEALDAAHARLEELCRERTQAPAA